MVLKWESGLGNNGDGYGVKEGEKMIKKWPQIRERERERNISIINILFYWFITLSMYPLVEHRRVPWTDLDHPTNSLTSMARNLGPVIGYLYKICLHC